jgi:hypothetical protein
MEQLSTLSQAIVALSVLYVWTFRFNNIVKEFGDFGLSEQTRTLVGTVKTILATLMLVGIWVSVLRLPAAAAMASMMLAAQYFHFKVKNPLAKRIPSAAFLGLCVLICLQN